MSLKINHGPRKLPLTTWIVKTQKEVQGESTSTVHYCDFHYSFMFESKQVDLKTPIIKKPKKLYKWQKNKQKMLKKWVRKLVVVRVS